MRVGALENSDLAPDPISQLQQGRTQDPALRIPPARSPSRRTWSNPWKDLVKFYLLGKEGLGHAGLWVDPELTETHKGDRGVRVLGRVLT